VLGAEMVTASPSAVATKGRSWSRERAVSVTRGALDASLVLLDLAPEHEVLERLDRG
jgi:hypothetical protein